MTNLRDITLAQSLKANKKARVSDLRSRLATEKEKLGITLKIPWKQAEEELAEDIVKLLDLKLLDLCVGAWKKYDELQQFADSKKYPIEEINKVPLLEHEIVSEHHPSLKISLQGVELQRLDFDLDITLKIQGGILTIQASKITAVSLGKCWGEATLKCKGIVLLQVETTELEFNESMELAEGVSIARNPS